MASNIDLLLEAERRGILPQDKAGLLAEARKRGLIPQAAPKEPKATPFEYKAPTMPEITFDAQGRPSEGMKDMTPENLKKAAAAGVDITTGAPGRFKGSLGDPAEMQAYQLQQLSQKLGYEPEVREGPDSGKPEYRTKGGRWTTFEPMGGFVDTPTARVLLEQGGSTVGAAAGSMIGIPLGPGGVAAMGTGGAISGAAAGRGLANKLGQMAGVKDPEGSITEGMGEAAQDAAIGEAVGHGILHGAKGVKLWFRGGKQFAADEAQALLDAQQRAQNLINQIEDGSGRRFSPTAAQVAANDPTLKDSDLSVLARRGQGFAESDIHGVGLQMEQQKAQNEAALKSYFDNLIEQETRAGYDKQQAGQTIGEGLADPYNTAVKAAKAEIAKLPPNVPEEQASEIITAALQAAKDHFDNTVRKPAYAAVNQAIGLNPKTFNSRIKIPWDNEAKEILNSISAEDRAIIRDFGDRIGTSAPSIRPGEDTTEISFGDDLTIDIKKSPASVDVAALNKEIRDIRAAIRAKNNGDTRIMADVKDLYRVQNALVGMRNRYLESNNPEVLDLIRKADTAAAQGISKFDRGLAGALLTMDKTGAQRLTQGKALERLLATNDPAELRNFADIVKSTPEAKDQVNQMLLALYRRDYTTQGSGIPTPKLHAKFLKDYSSVLDAFFDGEQRAKLTRLGGVADVVNTEMNGIKALGGRMAQDLGIRSYVTPEDFINKFMTGSLKPSQLQMALGTLRKYPGQQQVLNQWRAGIVDELSKRMIGKDGNIDINRLNSLINSDTLQNIRRLFNAGGSRQGGVIADGLETLRDATNLIRTKSLTGLNPAQQTALTGLARITYAPPMSREGLLVTFGQRSRRISAPEQLYDALTNPEELKRLTQQAKRYMAQLGFTSATSAYFAADDDDY